MPSQKFKKPTAADLRHDKEGIEENIRIRMGQLHYYKDCLRKQDRMLQEAQDGVEKAQAKQDAVIRLLRDAPDGIINLERGIATYHKQLYRLSVSPKLVKLAKIKDAIAALEADLAE